MLARSHEKKAQQWEQTANNALSVVHQAEKTAVNCAGVVEDFAARLNRLRAENIRLHVKVADVHFWPAIDGGVWAARGGAYCGWAETEQEARKQCAK